MRYDIANYLLENLSENFHPNYVKKNFGTKISEKFKMPIEEVMGKIKEADPSSDSRYSLFIASSWLDKRKEDIGTIRDMLFNLTQLGDKKVTGSRDLLGKIAKNKATFTQVSEFLNTASDIDYVSMLKKYEHVLTDGDISVYRVDKFVKNEDELHELFCKTSWCVRKKEDFDGYGAPFHLFMKNNLPFALVHFPSSQIKDVNDDIISDDKFSVISSAFFKLVKKMNVLFVMGDMSEIKEIQNSDIVCVDHRPYMSDVRSKLRFEFKEYIYPHGATHFDIIPSDSEELWDSEIIYGFSANSSKYPLELICYVSRDSVSNKIFVYGHVTIDKTRLVQVSDIAYNKNDILSLCEKWSKAAGELIKSKIELD